MNGCFIGQIDENGKSMGIVRLMNRYGGLYEGQLCGDKHGWGRYINSTGAVSIGWW